MAKPVALPNWALLGTLLLLPVGLHADSVRFQGVVLAGGQQRTCSVTDALSADCQISLATAGIPQVGAQGHAAINNTDTTLSLSGSFSSNSGFMGPGVRYLSSELDLDSVLLLPSAWRYITVWETASCVAGELGCSPVRYQVFSGGTAVGTGGPGTASYQVVPGANNYVKVFGTVALTLPQSFASSTFSLTVVDPPGPADATPEPGTIGPFVGLATLFGGYAVRRRFRAAILF